MSRFEELLETVETYQGLAAENYNRIRTLAEGVRLGLCRFLDAQDGDCVHLVPPVGQFQPRPYGDEAFSLPPRGFRPLGPVAFGLAVRVSKETDWLRITLECRKIGEAFVVTFENGMEYEFRLPLADADHGPFYKKIYDHIFQWFAEHIERYRNGDYGAREIGFDFADDLGAAQA